MLAWCPNCFQFLGEAPPYEDLSVQYGVCSDCPFVPQQHTTHDPHRATKIKKMMYSLWDAGTQDDVILGAHLVDEALDLGIRPIDIAMGLLAPLLSQIGRDWQHGRITVADEHRFTAFVESLFAMLTRQLRLQNEKKCETEGAKVLLMNAKNNTHDIGIRLLEIWFHTSGLPAKALIPPPSTHDLLEMIRKTRPEIIGLSVCLETHISCVQKLVKEVRTHFDHKDLQILIGGLAVKQGKVPHILGAILIPDVRMFGGILTPRQSNLQI